jgi:hypothetical protein
MSTAGRGAAYAIVTAIAIAVVLDLLPTLGTSAPHIYTGALLLAAVAVIAFVLERTAWKDNAGVEAAVPLFAVSAAGFFIVGLVGHELVPASAGQPNVVQTVGLIVILAVGALLLLSGSMPTISWSKLPVITTLVAMVMVGAYGAVILFMLNNVAAQQASWDRYLVVFTAVQGVGLAAVGALLGTQVKQGEVNAAKAETVDAKTKTQEAQADARRAIELADEVSAGAAAGRGPTADPATRAAGTLTELKTKYRVNR